MAGKINKDEKTIDIKKIGAIIEKNFIVLTRDRIRLLPLLLFPIFMILVLGFTTGNTPKHIPAAIVIYDESPLSQQIQQQVYDMNTFAVRYMVSTEGEAKNLLDEGKVSVIIEIPPNIEQNINNNIPVSITVIVDESDASIAATSNQALVTMIGRLSAQIALQKYASYQNAVNSAADSLGNYASLQTDNYASISANAKAVQAYSSNAQEALDAYIRQLQLNKPSVLPYILPVNYTTIYNGTYTNHTGSNIIYVEGSALQAANAQIAVMQGASSLMARAQSGAKSIQDATSSAQDTLAQHDYNNEVAQPLLSIQTFTQSNGQAVLQPLSYESKPAYGQNLKPIDFLIPSLIALTLFQGAVMGMGRAVAGEKREGSLTRVFLTPTSNTTIVIGTLLFYILFEMVRAIFLIAFSIAVFGIKIQGSYFLIALVLIIYIAISTAIGMMISSMVKTEPQFQAMAMLISLPTIFLSGVFFPLQAMPKVMQIISNFIPITYAADALRGVMVKALPLSMISYPMIILLIFFVATVGGVLMVFKRDIE